MKSTGRSAASSQSTVRATSASLAPLRLDIVAVPGRLLMHLGAFHEQVVGHVEIDWAGRPLVMVIAAWRMASGSISTRVGWKLRFTTGLMTLLKSA